MKFRCEACHKAMCNGTVQPDSSIVIIVSNPRGGASLVIKTSNAAFVCPHCGHEGMPLPQLAQERTSENRNARPVQTPSTNNLMLAAA